MHRLLQGQQLRWTTNYWCIDGRITSRSLTTTSAFSHSLGKQRLALVSSSPLLLSANVTPRSTSASLVTAKTMAARQSSGHTSRMHSNQVSMSLPIARGLIHAHVPQYRHEAVSWLTHSTGTVNGVFRIGTVATARFPLQSGDAARMMGSLQDMHAAMTEFADNCPFPAPRPLATFEADSGCEYPLPWSIQTWIEGEVAIDSAATLAKSDIFARGLAQLIVALRAVDTRGRCFNNGGERLRGGHLPDHDDWMDTCFENSKDVLDVPQCQKLWNYFRQLAQSGTDVMCHGDLTPANILVRDEHLVGILDTGGFAPADPALDLVVCWHMLDEERRDIVRKSLGCTEIEWKRGAAWAFEQAMGLVWYYIESNPQMSEMGRMTLRRVLDDADVCGASCRLVVS